MRITAGELKGRLIECPEDTKVRPTGSKIRQAFFNILAQQVPHSRFLDLFAGSGLMGLEALSRGAQSLIAVEENRALVKLIESNYRRLNVKAEVICADVRRVLKVLEPESFDLIFADPPYKSRLAESVLAEVGLCRLLSATGVLTIEHAREVDLPESTEHLQLLSRRIYGQTTLSFYQSAAQ